jgi:hypothetical protein
MTTFDQHTLRLIVGKHYEEACRIDRALDVSTYRNLPVSSRTPISLAVVLALSGCMVMTPSVVVESRPPELPSKMNMDARAITILAPPTASNDPWTVLHAQPTQKTPFFDQFTSTSTVSPEPHIVRLQTIATNLALIDKPQREVEAQIEGETNTTSALSHLDAIKALSPFHYIALLDLEPLHSLEKRDLPQLSNMMRTQSFLAKLEALKTDFCSNPAHITNLMCVIENRVDTKRVETAVTRPALGSALKATLTEAYEPKRAVDASLSLSAFGRSQTALSSADVAQLRKFALGVGSNTVVVTGFADHDGDAAKNRLLALERGFSARVALERAGVPAAQIRVFYCTDCVNARRVDVFLSPKQPNAVDNPTLAFRKLNNTAKSLATRSRTTTNSPTTAAIERS